ADDLSEGRDSRLEVRAVPADAGWRAGNEGRHHPRERRVEQRRQHARRRRYAVDGPAAVVEVAGASGLGALSAGCGAGAMRAGSGSGSIAARADALTVVRASTHTMFTAIGSPSVDCAGWKRDCFTAFTTELTSPFCTAVSCRRTLACSANSTS